MAGFIIGFDGEKAGAGDRIVRFAELAAIPSTTFAMLQALPNTALWHRLQKEGRLRENQDGNINQTTLMNFIPPVLWKILPENMLKHFVLYMTQSPI